MATGSLFLGIDSSGGMQFAICRIDSSHALIYPVLEFKNNLWGPGTDREPSGRTGPPAYVAATIFLLGSYPQ